MRESKRTISSSIAFTVGDLHHMGCFLSTAKAHLLIVAYSKQENRTLPFQYNDHDIQELTTPAGNWIESPLSEYPC